jgi:hypothetical protein
MLRAKTREERKDPKQRQARRGISLKAARRASDP